MKDFKVIIDGINITGSHFAAMPKDEAIKALAAERKGIVTTDEDASHSQWAAKAYDEIMTKANALRPDHQKEVAAELKQTTTEMQAVQKAEQKAADTGGK